MLTQENYFSKENQMKYWGSSQFKAFSECQGKALAELHEEYERDESIALLQGQYLDKMFEGGTELFEQQNKVFTRKGELTANFKIVQNAYDVIADDATLCDLCTGKQQKIFTGKIQGVEFKIMIDSLHDEFIVDRKLVKDFKEIWQDGEYVPFWVRWGYDIQAAIYQYIYEQNTGEKLPFMLACVSKEKVPDKEVFVFSQETLDLALDRVMSMIEEFQEVKTGKTEPYFCGECDYCRSIKKIENGKWVVL